MALLDELEALRTSALQEIAAAETADAVEAFRVRVLGRSGLLKDLMARIKEVPPADKKAVGQRLN
ncbi:MAG: phenylalanine--tRNA ligase subunit alpha, partial [Planctomycetes bacterium]|nr:phenylalanine--tRNA ligase subunit alpha [Planctomycetota bacterium]